MGAEPGALDDEALAGFRPDGCNKVQPSSYRVDKLSIIRVVSRDRNDTTTETLTTEEVFFPSYCRHHLLVLLRNISYRCITFLRIFVTRTVVR